MAHLLHRVHGIHIWGIEVTVHTGSRKLHRQKLKKKKKGGK